MCAETTAEILTAAQMRAIEASAIASGEVTGLALMERAGRGVVAAILDAWPKSLPAWGPAPKPPEFGGQDDDRPRAAVVLCGPGNNGGDGFVVARLLKEAGWDVEVLLYGDAEKLPPDARTNYARWAQIGQLRPLEACTSEMWARQPLVIDALFGTGLTRALPDLVHNVLLATLNCPRVAVDLPSTIATDTGRLLTPMPLPSAHLAVTFHRQKMGHVLAEGPSHCGRVVVVDIGLQGYGPAAEVAAVVTPALLSKSSGHKYSHGHALVLSGGASQGGAGRLAARAALRIGAGAVTVGCPPDALDLNAAHLNAVMLQPVADADGLRAILADRRINAICLGPGMGTGAREAALLDAMLGGAEPRPTVLDADALTLLAGDDVLCGRLHDRCVLTPHAGEFARLFPDLAKKLDGGAYSKVDATRDAARRAGCVVLFKGPDTVIADQDGRCSINASVYDRAAPWLATAGSGDVLAGFITGLLARGFSAMQAAETGAWLHTECALSFGPGLIAEDLPEVLPKVFRALGI